MCCSSWGLAPNRVLQQGTRCNVHPFPAQGSLSTHVAMLCHCRRRGMQRQRMGCVQSGGHAVPCLLTPLISSISGGSTTLHLQMQCRQTQVCNTAEADCGLVGGWVHGWARVFVGKAKTRLLIDDKQVCRKHTSSRRCMHNGQVHCSAAQQVSRPETHQLIWQLDPQSGPWQ